MRRNGIAGALWAVAQQVVTARRCIRLAAGIVLTAGVATAASALPVEYDYVGMNFVGGTGPYSTSNRITGDVVLDAPLPASAGISPTFLSYQFTDGINTISNSSSNAYIDGSFSTDQSGKIIASDITVRAGSYPNGNYNTIHVGVLDFATINIADCCYKSGGSGGAGTWSGPKAVAPLPAIYVTLAPEGPLSNDGKPTWMYATATVATSPPPLSVDAISSLAKVEKLNVSLPPGTTTIQDAASALGYQALDWSQQITRWVNPDLFAASDPGKTTPLTAPLPFYDPVLGGNLGVPEPNAVPPFYWSTNTGIFDRTSISANTNSLALAVLSSTPLGPSGASGSSCSKLAPNPPFPYESTLCFADHPMDPMLTPAQIALSQFPEFSTSLVGVVPCSPAGVGSCNVNGVNASAPLFNWTWGDTYNGLNGGVAYGSNDQSGDDPDGTGGITILSINGIPVSEGVPVPEPSSAALLLPAVLVLLIAVERKSHFRKLSVLTGREG